MSGLADPRDPGRDRVHGSVETVRVLAVDAVIQGPERADGGGTSVAQLAEKQATIGAVSYLIVAGAVVLGVIFITVLGRWGTGKWWWE